MLDFGKRLKSLRLEKGWTQEMLAKRLGLSKSIVSAYETSLRYPSYEILVRICYVYGVSADYLLGIHSRREIDTSGLSAENERLVYQLIDALREKG